MNPKKLNIGSDEDRGSTNSSDLESGNILKKEENYISTSGSSCSEEYSGPVETFEDLLKICGDSGRWQLRVFTLASFCGFLTALHNLVYAFIGASPDHWCGLPQVHGYTIDQLKNWTIPKDGNGDYESCFHYAWNTTSPNNGHFIGIQPEREPSWINEVSFPVIVNRNETESCRSTNIEFDTSVFDSTIVTDFNLVCGNQAWASLVQAMYMIGILVGSPIFGSISDRMGRKRAILISSLIFIVAGPLVALSPNFTLLMIARFILGLSSPGIYATSFVLVVETVGTEWRGLAGNLFCLPFALGYMVLPGVAYFFRDWRQLQLVLSAPSLIQLVFYFLTPESPRWLLRQGKVLEAEKILRQAAKTNQRSHVIPCNFSELVVKVAGIEKVENDEVSPSIGTRVKSWLAGYGKLVKSPRLRTRTLVLYVCWMSISMVYYGVALNAPNLSTDRYLYTFISGVLEIPSYAMVPPLIGYFGRRKIFSGFLLICGVSLLGSLLFGEGSILIVVLALFGKLLIGSVYSLIYLYATELMPTLLRTYGVGTASMVGRIGSASSPFIVDLLGGKQRKTYPTVVFGTVSLCAGLLSLLLPETKDKKLPETVRDVEEEQ